jgi:hypothetical protein
MTHVSKKRWGAVVLVATAVAGGLLAGGGTAQAKGSSALTLAVFGDAPYGLNPTDTSQLDRFHLFVDAINADPQVSAVVDVGDIHSGKSYCTEAYDRRIAQEFTRFTQSLVYTPGDNEWTDCHKPGEGGNVLDANGNPVDYANGNPVANLDLVRSLFFSVPGGTLGGGSLAVESQRDFADPAHPEDAAYVENVRWQRKDVEFVTLDIPGGSNNDADPWYGASSASAEQTGEAAARTAADLRWLDAAFTQAALTHASAVVVAEQADMWDLDGKTAAHLTNYEPFVRALAEHTNAFGGPVLLLDGDYHVYRSDNPFSSTAPCVTEKDGTEKTCDVAAAEEIAAGVAVKDRKYHSTADETATHPGYTVPTFHRITVHGSTYPFEWLKLTIDPHGGDFGPLSWSRQSTGITAATPAG